MNESPRMLAQLFDRDGSPRDRALWLVLAGIVASQLLAFFVVCVHQVELAQARHVEARQSSQTADATPARTLSQVR
jgi:hypothetical protein